MNERKLFQGNGKKSNKGITLIALVISIIVMLILAGVSLNATIGENGIVTKAQNAKLASEESKRREDLEYILYEYNSSSFLGQADGFTDYLENLKTEGRIDDYLYTDTLIVKYDGVYYETEKNGEYYEIKNKLEDDLTGGSGETGEKNYIVTPDNLTSGNIEIAEGSSYVVLDEVKGEDFNFEIPAGEPVTIKIMGDMNIDNKGYKRSAIDLEEGATLNLYVYGTVEVNSGYGEDASGNVAGKGGYAGIHVPEGATLNLYGTGTLTAIGGNAGSGGTLEDGRDNKNAGAGGTCCAGADGYTGGSGDMDESKSHNGLSGGKGKNNEETLLGGGGYFEGAEGLDKNGLNRRILTFGGMYNQGYWDNLRDRSGNGGKAGNGGNVKVSSSSQIYAYNGNLYTDGTDYENGLNQCPIYLQAGIVTAKYNYNSEYGDPESYKLFELILISNQSITEKSGYKNNKYDSIETSKKYVTKNSVLTNIDMSYQGVGSGAGYTEVSNGTYTSDSSMN